MKSQPLDLLEYLQFLTGVDVKEIVEYEFPTPKVIPPSLLPRNKTVSKPTFTNHTTPMMNIIDPSERRRRYKQHKKYVAASIQETILTSKQPSIEKDFRLTTYQPHHVPDSHYTPRPLYEPAPSAATKIYVPASVAHLVRKKPVKKVKAETRVLDVPRPIKPKIWIETKKNSLHISMNLRALTLAHIFPTDRVILRMLDDGKWIITKSSNGQLLSMPPEDQEPSDANFRYTFVMNGIRRKFTNIKETLANGWWWYPENTFEYI